MECSIDSIQVLRAFGQDQYLAFLSNCIADLGGDGLRPSLVIGEMPKNVLNTCICWQVDPRQA